MAQPLVLAIEPDLRQAAIVKRIVREQALAEVAVVDSRDAAIEAMRTRMPDVLLLSALMSPRDEDELIAHLKTLENAGHLQTHTIPQLASSLGPGEERASGGLLSAFRRKKDPAPVPGCDPDLFAEEIRVFLQRAADKKSQQQSTSFTAVDMRPSATASTRAAAAPADEPAADAPSSAWSSPFEWKPSGSSARATRAPEATPAKAPPPATPLAAVPIPEPSSPEPSVLLSSIAPDPVPAPETAVVEPPVAAAAPPPAPAPSVVIEPVHASAPVAEPVVHVTARPVTAPDPVPAPKPAAAKPSAPEPARPKPVADRAAKATPREIYRLVTGRATKDLEIRDRLGPLARWARNETPRAAKTAPVTGEDVRALILSLAVPAAVASVSYPSGCRIRRVRVPVSPDHDGAASGPVILSRRTAAEQRDKHPSA